MTTRIRFLLQHDAALPGLVELMQEMQTHYRVYCPPCEEIVAGLVDRPAAAEILLCEEEEGFVAGFAAFCAIYPGPGLSPGIFLKEIYVRAARRDRGIGEALLRALAATALSRGFSRIDWTADASDTRLVSYYERLGGVPRPDKLFFRLDGEALGKLADGAAIASYGGSVLPS
ncbi:GNAT family N-acetyltransferase [Sinorhizobium meliloti]|uniref:GNAT family N-acetyltransferase n=1 Tax=Rhizobium meliloti TaxID=382 RepID=UPI00035C6EA2|nr:GNAT family N-acetyltransferase [Sinorhizobium meliloti]